MVISGITLGESLLVSFIDLTERKKLEDQLRQAQKMEAIGQLAGGVAHDFNNILAAILLQLDFLKQDSDFKPEALAGLEEIKDEAKRAANLTRQLLLFSRQSTLETKVLDINEVVANLLKMLGRLLGENVTLVFERRNNLGPIEADAGMLDQVLVNLAVNARDSMPNGGRITLAAEAIEIDSRMAAVNPDRKPGRFVRISVSDEGCGMDAATLKRIYEPFFTTKPAGKGTGLGLATVYGIVAQHRGWIEVESEVGQGTTFTVYFPESKRSVAPSVLDNSGNAPRGHDTILVVEDDGAVRLVLVRTLKSLGYQVIEAANGHEALAQWAENREKISLLITDMVMPEGMTGSELARRLRAEKPDLGVIISSGYNSE
jgi:signal transduction histidine kinase